MSLSDEQKQQYRQRLQLAIEDGDTGDGVALAQVAMSEGATALEFFQAVIEPVLAEVGDRFSRLEIFLPDLMRAGAVIKAMQQQVLEPAVRSDGVQGTSLGTVVIGTCQGDIHDIGKNMVSLMLQVNGFRVIDLGTNISPRDFIDAARRESADIIALSALLTPSMPYMRDVVELLNGFGLRDRFMVVAGGAPVSQEWATSVGMDGFADDAVAAVEVCRRLVAERGRRMA